MDIRVTGGDITQAKADAIIVNLFEGVTTPGGGTGAADTALDGAISKLIAQGDIRGKSGEFTVIHTFGKIPAARVVVAGLGKQKDFDIDAVRNLAANPRGSCESRGSRMWRPSPTAPGSPGWTRKPARRRSPRGRCSANTAS